MRGWQLLSNAFYGESPNGEWTIQLVDLAAGANDLELAAG